jgi:hypothetical protein
LVDRQIGKDKELTAHFRKGKMGSMTTTIELVDLARARDLARSGLGRLIRVSAELTLVDVGSAVGIAPSTVWRWERGDRTPHGEAALKWAALMFELQGRDQRGRS